MKGRRLADTEFGELPCSLDEIQPGDYWLYLRDGALMNVQREGNLTGLAAGIVTPTGAHGTLMSHTIRVEDDGTISVRAGDGSSNSIEVSSSDASVYWHGYIEHGEWRSV